MFSKDVTFTMRAMVRVTDLGPRWKTLTRRRPWVLGGVYGESVMLMLFSEKCWSQ